MLVENRESSIFVSNSYVCSVQHDVSVKLHRTYIHIGIYHVTWNSCGDRDEDTPPPSKPSALVRLPYGLDKLPFALRILQKILGNLRQKNKFTMLGQITTVFVCPHPVFGPNLMYDYVCR